jgi:hypothetical protein
MEKSRIASRNRAERRTAYGGNVDDCRVELRAAERGQKKKRVESSYKS